MTTRPTHSTVEAANAGLDQEMPNGIFFSDRLMEAIQTGQVSLPTLDDKVLQILRTMFAFGLFDRPVQIMPLPVQDHGKLAREIAGKGIVLLKNTDSLLPLVAAISCILWPSLEPMPITTSREAEVLVVQPTYFVSILEGIRRRAGEGVQVEYAEGTDPPSAAALLPGPPALPSSSSRQQTPARKSTGCGQSIGRTLASRANPRWYGSTVRWISTSASSITAFLMRLR